MANQRLLLALLLSAACPAAWAQAPVGPEFQVNSFTTGIQEWPSVALDAIGNFVVVWNDYGPTSYGIFGQRFNAAGVPRGSEFQISAYTLGQYVPEVTSDAAGNFVVVWQASDPNTALGVFGRRYDADGVPRGGEFKVGDTWRAALAPAVASDATGNFVVVWEGGDLYGNSIFAQRYDADGGPRGGVFRVNAFTTLGTFGSPAVSSAANGSFVVVWAGMLPGPNDADIFARRYSADGIPQGSQFRVNSYTTSRQGGPRVASVVGGTSDTPEDFVVVWSGYFDQDGSNFGVFGQRFDDFGLPQGTEFRVNSYTTGFQGAPTVTAGAGGSFVVVWTSYLQDGSNSGVFGQRFDTSGLPRGTEFRVNSYTTGAQGGGLVASNATGDFVAVWRAYGQDGSSFGIFGQRFGDLIFRDGFQ